MTDDIGAGGTVHAYITNLGTDLGPVSATIMHANGAVTNNGIAGEDQGPLTVDVSTTAQTVDINVAIDLAVGGGLSTNAQVLGDLFQGWFESTVPGGLTPDQEAFYLGLINYGDTAAYDGLLNDLHDAPAAFGATVPTVFWDANAFACQPVLLSPARRRLSLHRGRKMRLGRRPVPVISARTVRSPSTTPRFRFRAVRSSRRVRTG